MTNPENRLTHQHIAEKRHRIGIAIMLTSAVVFSTAGLFTKGVTAGAWSVIFWRGVFAAIFTMLFVIYKGRMHQEVVKMGWSGAFNHAKAVGLAADALGKK